MPVPLPPIEELDRLDLADFAGALARIFEPNPLLLERLAGRRPFRSYAEVVRAAGEVIAGMSEAERTALLASHPRIGARGAMSESSRREQGPSAGAEVELELERLQREYERRFGFRFVTFVDRRPREAILAELRQRVARSRDVELAAGVGAYLSICADRAGVSLA